MIGLDTETPLVSPDVPIQPLVCISAASEDGGACVIKWDNAHAKTLCKSALEEGAVFANAPYDLAGMAQQYEMWPDVLHALRDGNVYDVLTQYKLVQIATEGRVPPKVSLSKVSEIYTGDPLDKKTVWRRNYAVLRDIPVSRWPKEAKDYAADDAIRTLEIQSHLERELTEIDESHAGADLRGARHVHAAAHMALFMISRNGILVNRELAEERRAEMTQELSQYDVTLKQHGLLSPTGSVRVKVAQHMLEDLGCDLVRTGKTEAPSLSESALLELGDKVPDGSAIDIFRKRKALKGRESRFSKTFLEHPVIRCRFEEMLVTGRTATSNPQTTNWVKSWKDCATPREGNVFVGCDWSAMESVCVAEVMSQAFGHSVLADSINAGEDVHVKVVCNLLGIPYDVGMERKAAGTFAKERRMGKPINFGLSGGAGIDTFIRFSKNKPYYMEFSRQEAIAAKKAWLATFPEFAEYLAWGGAISESGPATVVHSLIGAVRADCSYSDALNYLFQAFAAHIAKVTLFRILWRQKMEPQSALYGTKQVMFIHDDNVLECERGKGRAVAEELMDLMCSTIREFCPHVQGAGAESWYGERLQ